VIRLVNRRSNHKTIIVAISAVVLILIVFVVGYWLGHFSSPAPTQSNSTQLTIASFEKEVESGLSSYLNLVISNYWVEGNKVRCTGTVNWLGGDYAVSGAAICMYITEKQTNSVNVKVVVYSGMLLLPRPGTIDSESVQIPTLGNGVFSFDFSLSCIYR